MSKADVYRNLNKPGVQFSVRVGGRVAHYASVVKCERVTFKHATPKQLQAVRTGARQVCQWIKCESSLSDSGHWAELDLFKASTDGAVRYRGDEWRRVDSDPKRFDGFQLDGKRLAYAGGAWLCGSGLWVRDWRFE